jgi:hypothetical protein
MLNRSCRGRVRKSSINFANSEIEGKHTQSQGSYS